jgi:hypothetical protein
LGDGNFGVVGPGVYAHVLDLVGVVAQPGLAAQRLGAFRAFLSDGEQGLEVRYASAGLDLDKFIVLVAPRGANANLVYFFNAAAAPAGRKPRP